MIFTNSIISRVSPCIHTQTAVYKHPEHTAHESSQMSDMNNVLMNIVGPSLLSMRQWRALWRLSQFSKHWQDWLRAQCSTDPHFIVFLQAILKKPMVFRAPIQGPSSGHVDHESGEYTLSSIRRERYGYRQIQNELEVICQEAGCEPTTSIHILPEQWQVYRSAVVSNGKNILVCGIFSNKLHIEIVSSNCSNKVFEYSSPCGPTFSVCSASVCPTTNTDFFVYMASGLLTMNTITIHVFHVSFLNNQPTSQKVDTIQVTGFLGNSTYAQLRSMKCYTVQTEGKTVEHQIVMRVLCNGGDTMMTYVLHIPGDKPNAVVDVTKDSDTVKYQSADEDLYVVVDAENRQMIFLGPDGYWTDSKSDSKYQMHTYAQEPGDCTCRYNRISFHRGMLFVPGHTDGPTSPATDVLMFGLDGTMYTKPAQAHITEA